MRIKYKVIEFKTLSPMFEMERDGIKPFTVRHRDRGDPRFRALARWKAGWNWLIKIINPATGDYFYRKLMGKRYMVGPGLPPEIVYWDWLIIYLGEEIKEE